MGLRRITGLVYATCANKVGEHSHAIAPAHFASPGLCCGKPLFGRTKRYIQPERHTKWGLKIFNGYVDKNKKRVKINIMKALTVSEIKTHFSDILFQVKNGEKVKILYGKSKKPISMIIPLEDTNTPRKIGILDGIASYKEEGDGKISIEEFLEL